MHAIRRILPSLAVLLGAIVPSIGLAAHGHDPENPHATTRLLSPCEDASSRVSPCDPGTSVSTPVNGSGSYQFTVTNLLPDGGTVHYFSASYTGGIASASVSESSFGLGIGESRTVTLSWQMGGAQVNGTVTLEITGSSSLNTTVSVTAEAPFTIDASFTSKDYDSPALCEAGCFSARAAHSTAPYFSLDSPRGVTIVYDGDRAFPRPFIYADVTKLASSQPVSYWSIEATLNGSAVTFVNGDTRVYYDGNVSEPVRLAGQIDMRNYWTGTFTLAITVRARHTDGNDTYKTTTHELIVAHDGESPIARGWTIAGLQRLYFPPSGYLIVEGSGAAVRFTALNQGTDFSTLSQEGSNYVRTYLDGTKVTFNTLGYQTAVTDRLGRVVRFVYDGSNRLIRVTDPVRRYGNDTTYITLNYGANGLSSIVEPGTNGQPGAGRTTTFSVYADRTLRHVTDPDGKTREFAYDDSLRLWKEIDPNGGIKEFAYGQPSWKVTQLIYPLVEIDAGNGNTSVETIRVNFTPWQTVGVATSATSSAAPATAASRNTIQGVVQDGEGMVTRFTVDRWGQPLVLTEPLGRRTTITRAGLFVTAVQHPNGFRDEYTYTNGLLTSMLPAGSAAVTFRYGVNAQVDSIGGAGTRAERRFLGTNGRVDSVLFAGGEKVRYEYDALERVVKFKDHTGDSTLYAYDAAFGNVRRTQIPSGRVDSTVFDGYGRDSVAASTGLPARAVLYDAINRATHLYDGVNASPTIIRYDALNDTTVTDPKGQVYRFQRNVRGWLSREYTANSTMQYKSFRYDKAGRLKSWTNRRGQRVNMAYDSLSRMTSKSGDNTSTDTFVDDIYGFASVASNSVSVDSLSVDPYSFSDSTVIRVGGNRFRIYRTDADGFTQPDTMTVTTSVSGLSFPTRRYTYDSNTGRLASFGVGTQWSSALYTWSTEGERITSSHTDGITRTESYTRAHQRQEATYDYAEVRDAFRRAYRFDFLGRVTAEQRPDASGTKQRAFGYDGLGRLTSVEHRNQSCNVWPGGNPDSLSTDFGWRYTCANPSSTESYTYDAAGNRTSQSGTYTDGNRVTALGSFTFEHDGDGNITRRVNGSTGQDRRFYWSAESLLDSVATIGGDRVHYQYNAFGQPVIRKRNGAVERYFLWDGDDLLAELDAAFNRVAEHVYLGTDVPFGLLTHNPPPLSLLYHHQDELGNVHGLRSGVATYQTVTNDTWGKATVTGVSENRLYWKGLRYESDGVDLYYMRARWYDPEIGRFISEDPLGLAGGVNQYAFAGNDPINGWDPSGLDGCTPAGLRAGGRTVTIGGKDWCQLPVMLPPVVVIGKRDFPQHGEEGWMRNQRWSLSDLMGLSIGGWMAADDVEEVEGDPCEVYADAPREIPDVYGICRRVHSPLSSRENACAANCLAARWQALTTRLGRQPTGSERTGYLVRGHAACYRQCGYSVPQFRRDYSRRAGTYGRTILANPRLFFPDLGMLFLP